MSYDKAIQAKHIPELPILQFLSGLRTGKPNYEVANWYDLDCGDDGNPRSVRHAMPAGTPGKVVLAKMAALVKRGLVDGCPCGCHGGFSLTHSGWLELLPTSWPKAA